ncbi:uncharacterized protein Z520_01221 [Fonsecaea multimorphosa CBS 102226]|uniref:Expansin-like EG45 domain-containing protein n=1 Tax=Fonsecaea multimorphosa CBS 102226 TaxID=1442371 RepID=A0A0D2HLH4_9EURO|nr:uncharacterized protein Z520_01221 [Fonsecaea multimorphosa CBS 102226]KIY02756.1 hypothetical protein Z520_01221 [Fonsecaea multimorphosa CBS 102226]
MLILTRWRYQLDWWHDLHLRLDLRRAESLLLSNVCKRQALHLQLRLQPRLRRLVQPVSPSQSPSSSPTSAPPPATSTSPATSSGGLTYKASFTHYGAGDSFGSPNCNTNTAACFFYTYPGFSAAVSQNLYGAGPGQGQGPACGTCWKLVGETDSSGNALSNAGTSIVVMINNLCPADGNPLCAQNGLSGTNQYGANVNFDLCSDSGASEAFFGNSGVGLAVGTATQVDCSEWTGTIVH